MKQRRTRAVVAAAALVLTAAVGYWAYTARKERGRAVYLPLSLHGKGGKVADYYVDNAVPGPGTGAIGDPWDDIATNIGTLVAGDTMHVRGDAGAYRVYNEAEIDVTANGTAVNPITIQPYGTERVEIRTPAGSYIFDLHGDWFVVNGKATTQLYLNKNDVSGNSAIYVRNTASDCTIQYAEIANVRGFGTVVRITGDRTTIAYNDIHDGYNGPSGDCPGVMVQDGDDVVIEYNVIHDVNGDCINVDDAAPNAQGTIIRYNHLYTTLGPCAENGLDAKYNSIAGNQMQVIGNTFHGFRACTGTCGGSGDHHGEALSLHNSCDNVLVEDNIIYDSTSGISVDDNGQDIIIRRNVIYDLVDSATDVNAQVASMCAIGIDGRNIQVYNNTIDGAPEYSIWLHSHAGADVEFYNNVFRNCGPVNDDGLTPTADYNNWSNCAGALAGPHDVTDNPLFVDEAGHDYHLQDTSPCIDVGLDVGLPYSGTAPDLGAFEWEATPADDPLIPVSPAPPAAVSGGGASAYQIWLRDWNGDRIAVFTGTGRETGGLRRFSFLKLLRKPGVFAVELDGSDERIESFILDYQVEFWRRDQFGGLDWYRVFEAFHRADTYRQTESGQDIYMSDGQHYNVLLLAEPIFYPAGSAYTSKSGPAETVAKEYTNENIGPAATSPPRDYSGVMPGLTIEADNATGATWSGGRAKQNLLDVLVELAEHAPADFMVEGTGSATFELRWRPDQWGEDKTWRNAAGRPAVVFDGRLGNASNTLYEYDRKNEINVCHVLGQGSGEDRRIETRTSGAEDDSPWNQRSVCRDARNTYSTEGLNRKGDEVLDKMRSRVATQVNVAQTAATRLDRDWGLGDIVTVRYRNFEVAQKINGVRVTVDQDGRETIQAIMEAP